MPDRSRFSIVYSDEISDLINQLLNKDPSKRIGTGPDDAEEIKKHPAFAKINWGKLNKKEIVPIFVPKFKDMTK